MSDTIEALMTANLLEVFGERDGERRRAAIARTYTEDVEFLDPDEITTGQEALDAKAQRLLDDAPGFVFRPAGRIYVNHDMGSSPGTSGPRVRHRSCAGWTPASSATD